MNELQIFESPIFGTIRTLKEGGKVLFCAKDIAVALGYKRPKDAIAAHCKGAVKRRSLTGGGEQEMNFIPEGDIYRLAAKSELPGAYKFESWIFDEVLPSIRKHGVYISDKSKKRAIEAKHMNARARVAAQWIKSISQNSSRYVPVTQAKLLLVFPSSPSLPRERNTTRPGRSETCSVSQPSV